MTLDDSTPHDGSETAAVILAASNDEHQTSPDERDNDWLTENFLFLFPVALFFVLAVFALALAFDA
jgi:hypothetical protein